MGHKSGKWSLELVWFVLFQIWHIPLVSIVQFGYLLFQLHLSTSYHLSYDTVSSVLDQKGCFVSEGIVRKILKVIISSPAFI